MNQIACGTELENYMQSINDIATLRLRERYRHKIDTLNLQWLAKVQFLEETRAEYDFLPSPFSRVSALMVVKDEFRTIRDAIGSIANICGEIVIVDTGSTDGTYEIITNIVSTIQSPYNGLYKVYRKEFIPWSFAKAKGFALGECTKPFIFVFDGDEELYSLTEDPFVLENTVTSPRFDYVPNKWVVRMQRIFPRQGLIVEGDVHNEFIPPGNMKHIAPKYLEILHWTEMTPGKKEAREGRGKTFMDELFRSGASLNDYFKCCKLCISGGDWKSLREVWKDGHALYDGASDQERLYFKDWLLMPSFAALSDNDFSIWRADEHIRLVGDTVDNQFCSFVYCYRNGEFPQALCHAQRYMDLCKTEPDQPFTSQATLQWKAEVQFKSSLIERYMELNDGKLKT